MTVKNYSKEREITDNRKVETTEGAGGAKHRGPMGLWPIQMASSIINLCIVNIKLYIYFSTS
jgi:hypothetical protein